jgi:hypothetical protein
LPGDSGEESVEDSGFPGDPGVLLRIPADFARDVTEDDFDEEDFPLRLARLPTFVRTFFLRFLGEIYGLKIEAFTSTERTLVSDFQVDLETKNEDEEAWPLLFDFVDFCDLFEDIGLMSIPDEATEHEKQIFDLTVRLLEDLAWWAEENEHDNVAEKSGELAWELNRIARNRRL